MNIVPINNSSPFDSIRHFDENGNEFWLARELMIVMGYVKWQNFHQSVKEGFENIKLTGDNPFDHITDSGNLVKRIQGGGSGEKDYKLTRYGAYMVALACDGRKPEVALAKKYFAIKTREAEVIIPQQNEKLELAKIENENLRLENENLKLKINYTERRTAIAQLQGVQFLALIDGNPNAVVEIKEKVTETIVCRGNSSVNFTGRSTAQVAKELGFKTGKDLEMWLSQNNADHLICQGLRAVQAPYIPEENIKEVKYLFNRQKSNGSLQLSIGE